MATCLLSQGSLVPLAPLCTFPSVLPFIHLSLQSSCHLFCSICFLYARKVNNQGIREVQERERRESLSPCSSKRQVLSQSTPLKSILPTWYSSAEIHALLLPWASRCCPCNKHQWASLWRVMKIVGSKRACNHTLYLN